MKNKKVKRIVILLTKAEYYALFHMIENGWGDGDFESYGGQSKKIQHRAREKFFSAPTKGVLCQH